MSELYRRCLGSHSQFSWTSAEQDPGRACSGHDSELRSAAKPAKSTFQHRIGRSLWRHVAHHLLRVVLEEDVTLAIKVDLDHAEKVGDDKGAGVAGLKRNN